MSMEFDMFNFNDCVFYGNSYTMDLITNMYFYRQFGIEETNIQNHRNIHPLGPGTLLVEYFRDYGIHPVVDSIFHEILLKEGCPTDLDMLEPKGFTTVSPKQLPSYLRVDIAETLLLKPTVIKTLFGDTLQNQCLRNIVFGNDVEPMVLATFVSIMLYSTQ